MAGALSLQEDIEALVEKHKDVALPVDLLSRLAEDARLMAVKANIRCEEGKRQHTVLYGLGEFRMVALELGIRSCCSR